MLRMHKRMMRNREGRKKGAKRQKEFRSRIWQSSRDWACDICHPCVWHRPHCTKNRGSMLGIKKNFAPKSWQF
jgi:hypothetical protein